MVEHCKDYPWSSFHHNALDIENELIKQHTLYLQLGINAQLQINYRNLFNAHLSEKLLYDIRESINKSWALGSEVFWLK